MNKFYILEEMTQDDLNKLALERNTLAHNWNELKKWLEEYFNGITIDDIDIENFYKKGAYRMREYTLEKMQELEEGGNNE